jgi:hypothetical protein
VYTSLPSVTRVAPGCSWTACNTSAPPPGVMSIWLRVTVRTEGAGTLGVAAALDATTRTGASVGGAARAAGAGVLAAPTAESRGGAGGPAAVDRRWSTLSVGKSAAPRRQTARALSAWPARAQSVPRYSNGRANIATSVRPPCCAMRVSNSRAARGARPTKAGER